MVRAEKILTDNIEILHRLSEELLEREILDSDEIDKIIKGEDLPPLKRESVEDLTDLKEPDEVPEHVKKLMTEREKRKSENQDNSGNDSN